ncbi:MAG: MBL fold metallo-hydrolase [Patescibacteria group bacterium]
MPKITLTSYGATQEVTGSCHLLKVDDFRVLIDCGFWQGGDENYLKNWSEFDFDAKSIDAVILTHAHLDHCGRLPLLFKRGFRGPVFATKATRQLADIILADSFKVMQERVAEHSLSWLYAQTDLDELNKHWTLVNYHKNNQLNSELSFTLYNSGHILGASLVEIKAGPKTIVFTGDIGGENMPLVKNIEYLSKADFVIMESTYGDRLHEQIKNRNAKLLEAVQRVTRHSSTLIIAVFAIERAQDILKVLNDYYEKHLDFRVPVYLDSPMAYEATKIYKQNVQDLNVAAQGALEHDHDIFSFPHLKITNTAAQSKQINLAPAPKIILAGAGMADGGRIIHHLAVYASQEKNHILFMGYQVPGTLGHALVNGAFDFRYGGHKIPIRAGVEKIDGFSAHADQAGLLKWLEAFKNKPKVFLVHGDPTATQILADKIQKDLGFAVQAIKIKESIVLN